VHFYIFSGHGTQCAGVIAAEANNSLCGVGVAYGCNIAGQDFFILPCIEEDNV
jgi:subtilisin family serine protease